MKLKYSIIEKLNKLSAKEFDLLFFAAKRQEMETGHAEGIYYRDVMKHTGMCKQSFYNALNGLRDKGIITYTKGTDMDYDICIIDNDFPDRESLSQGYVKLSRKAFRSKAYRLLKAPERYMLLEFLKGTHKGGHSIQISVDKLYEKFKDILGVSKRVIRGYLHSLRKFFAIGIKQGKYYITYLHSVFEDEGGHKSEALRYREHLVKKECWRNHISYDGQSIEDTAGFVAQYYKIYGQGMKAMIDLLMNCIRISVEDVERKDRTLSAPYVHKIVREKIFIYSES